MREKGGRGARRLTGLRLEKDRTGGGAVVHSVDVAANAGICPWRVAALALGVASGRCPWRNGAITMLMPAATATGMRFLPAPIVHCLTF